MSTFKGVYMPPNDDDDDDEKARDAWLTRQLGRLRAAYPSFRPDENGVSEWRRVLYELSRKRGRAAVSLAIEKIIDTVPRFVPSLAEVHLFLPPLAPRRCSACRQSDGWLYVRALDGRVERVTRCQHQGGA